MMNTTYLRTAALLALVLAACTTQTKENVADVGTLAVPLTSTGSNGAQFALSGVLELVGPETISHSVSVTDPNVTDDTYQVSPRVGSYTLTLQNWSIHKLTADAAGMMGTYVPVSGATLLSSAVVAVEILSNQTTDVLYRFSVPGEGTIVFARGTLRVDFNVDEGFPAGAACTTDVECASHICDAAGVCAAASCNDGVQNGGETSPDCGPTCMCTGGTTACNAGQLGMCPAGSMCFIDAAGVAQCVGPNPAAGTPCTMAQAQACPAGATVCVADGVGGIICSTGGMGTGGAAGATCDPTSAATSCDPGLSCLGTAAAGYTCQAAGLPTGAMCAVSTDCASLFCSAATNTCQAAGLPTGAACMTNGDCASQVCLAATNACL